MLPLHTQEANMLPFHTRGGYYTRDIPLGEAIIPGLYPSGRLEWASFTYPGRLEWASFTHPERYILGYMPS